MLGSKWRVDVTNLYFLLKNTFQCTYSSYTILLLIVFYTLVCCTETACIPPARRPKSPSAAGLLPYRILEGSVRWSEVSPTWWSNVRRWCEVISLTDFPYALLISRFPSGHSTDFPISLYWFPDFPRATLLISRFPFTDFPISLVPLFLQISLDFPISPNLVVVPKQLISPDFPWFPDFPSNVVVPKGATWQLREGGGGGFDMSGG